MNRYVLRDGQVVRTKASFDGLDMYCYKEQSGETTCMFLSDKAEVAFLLNYGEELNVSFTGAG